MGVDVDVENSAKLEKFLFGEGDGGATPVTTAPFADEKFSPRMGAAMRVVLMMANLKRSEKLPEGRFSVGGGESSRDGRRGAFDGCHAFACIAEMFEQRKAHANGGHVADFLFDQYKDNYISYWNYPEGEENITSKTRFSIARNALYGGEAVRRWPYLNDRSHLTNNNDNDNSKLENLPSAQAMFAEWLASAAGGIANPIYQRISLSDVLEEAVEWATESEGIAGGGYTNYRTRNLGSWAKVVPMLKTARVHDEDDDDDEEEELLGGEVGDLSEDDEEQEEEEDEEK